VQVGIAYRSETNRYEDLTNAMLERDFAVFKQNGVTLIDIWLYWSAVESSRGVYRDTTTLADVRRIAGIAAKHGISLNICIHTIFNTSSSLGVPSFVTDSYTGLQRTMAILHDSDDRTAFVNMVVHVVQTLKDIPNIRSWNPINEPNQNLNLTTAEVESMLNLFVQLNTLIQNQDPRSTVGPRIGPTKFTELWHNDERLYAFDIFGMTYYGATDNPAIEAIAAEVKRRGKEFWIMEAGENTTNDTLQTNSIKSYASWFNQIGIAVTLYVVWHTRNATVTGYNLNADTNGTPRPAFDYLNYQGEAPLTYDFYVKNKSGTPLLATVKVGSLQVITEQATGYGRISSTSNLLGQTFTVTATGYPTFTGTVQSVNNVTMGEAPPPTSQVSITVAGSGTVEEQSGTYTLGSTLLIHAHPAQGWHFVTMARNGLRWTDSNPGEFLNLAEVEVIVVVFEQDTGDGGGGGISIAGVALAGGAVAFLVWLATSRRRKR
jgi:hypothetical protein